MKKFDSSKPSSWIRVWVALVLGTLLGSYLVPALSWKIGNDSDWSNAFQQGWNNLLDNGVPTVIFLTGLLVVILLFVFFNKKTK